MKDDFYLKHLAITQPRTSEEYILGSQTAKALSLGPH